MCGQRDVSSYDAFTSCTSHKEPMNTKFRLRRFHSSPGQKDDVSCVIELRLMINDSTTPGGLGKYACVMGPSIHTLRQWQRKHDSGVQYWNWMWKQRLLSRDATSGRHLMNYVSPWFVWSRGSCNNSRLHCSCFSLPLKVTFEKHKAGCLQ
jgi:hypothetical protein